MKKLLTGLIALAFLGGVTLSANAAAVRNYVSIVGSSTVYPFATVVAEQFGKTSSFKTPKIESTGSGGGFKLFCAGVGVEHPDITNASRRIKKSELEQCKANGVSGVIEVKIGYDGIVVANSKKSPRLNVSLEDLFLALAKDVPSPSSAKNLVPNPYKTWQDVNADLPATPIKVLGPPPTSGTRDAFVELVMEGGAFLDQNTDKIQGAAVDGVAPTFEAINNGEYPVSRPLFFYVKKAHIGIIPGLQEYLNEFTSDKAWGPDGYLGEKGLIPMPDEERNEFSQSAASGKPLTSLE